MHHSLKLFEAAKRLQLFCAKQHEVKGKDPCMNCLLRVRPTLDHCYVCTSFLHKPKSWVVPYPEADVMLKELYEDDGIGPLCLTICSIERLSSLLNNGKTLQVVCLEEDGITGKYYITVEYKEHEGVDIVTDIGFIAQLCIELDLISVDVNK